MDQKIIQKQKEKAELKFGKCEGKTILKNMENTILLKMTKDSKPMRKKE